MDIDVKNLHPLEVRLCGTSDRGCNHHGTHYRRVGIQGRAVQSGVFMVVRQGVFAREEPRGPYFV